MRRYLNRLQAGENPNYPARAPADIAIFAREQLKLRIGTGTVKFFIDVISKNIKKGRLQVYCGPDFAYHFMLDGPEIQVLKKALEQSQAYSAKIEEELKTAKTQIKTMEKAAVTFLDWSFIEKEYDAMDEDLFDTLLVYVSLRFNQIVNQIGYQGKFSAHKDFRQAVQDVDGYDEISDLSVWCT